MNVPQFDSTGIFCSLCVKTTSAYPLQSGYLGHIPPWIDKKQKQQKKGAKGRDKKRDFLFLYAFLFVVILAVL